MMIQGNQEYLFGDVIRLSLCSESFHQMMKEKGCNYCSECGELL